MENQHHPTMRVVKILEAVACTPKGMTFSEISKTLELPKSTLVPILKTLRESGFLRLQENTGLYFTGYKLFSIGNQFLERFDIMDEIGKELRRLSELFGETCYFGIREGGNVLYLQKKENTDSLGVLTAIGKTKPAYGTGLGKALLIDMEEEELKQLYPEGLKPLTDNTICDFEKLSKELSRQRELGYAWEREESTPYICCFAVPVRKRRKVVGAVSIAFPVFRYREETKEDMIRELLEVEKRLEKAVEETDARFDWEV